MTQKKWQRKNAKMTEKKPKKTYIDEDAESRRI